MADRGTTLLIWDWNGTLLDDTELCWSIANRMRAERGMPTMSDVEEYRGVFGFPVIDYYRRMGYTFAQESYEAVSEEFLALYAAGVAGCPLQPHVRETLEEVRRRGIRQVLLSATGSDRLGGQVALFGLTDCFDEIVGGDDNLAHGKAEKARLLMERQSAAPGETLFIGDTDHDREVAAAVGCRCALLTRGHQPKAHLGALGVPLLGDVREALLWL